MVLYKSIQVKEIITLSKSGLIQQYFKLNTKFTKEGYFSLTTIACEHEVTLTN